MKTLFNKKVVAILIAITLIIPVMTGFSELSYQYTKEEYYYDELPSTFHHPEYVKKPQGTIDEIQLSIQNDLDYNFKAAVANRDNLRNRFSGIINAISTTEKGAYIVSYAGYPNYPQSSNGAEANEASDDWLYFFAVYYPYYEKVYERSVSDNISMSEAEAIIKAEEEAAKKEQESKEEESRKEEESKAKAKDDQLKKEAVDAYIKKLQDSNFKDFVEERDYKLPYSAEMYSKIPKNNIVISKGNKDSQVIVSWKYEDFSSLLKSRKALVEKIEKDEMFSDITDTINVDWDVYKKQGKAEFLKRYHISYDTFKRYSRARDAIYGRRKRYVVQYADNAAFKDAKSVYGPWYESYTEYNISSFSETLDNFLLNKKGYIRVGIQYDLNKTPLNYEDVYKKEAGKYEYYYQTSVPFGIPEQKNHLKQCVENPRCEVEKKIGEYVKANHIDYTPVKNALVCVWSDPLEFLYTKNGVVTQGIQKPVVKPETLHVKAKKKKVSVYLAKKNGNGVVFDKTAVGYRISIYKNKKTAKKGKKPIFKKNVAIKKWTSVKIQRTRLNKRKIWKSKTYKAVTATVKVNKKVQKRIKKKQALYICVEGYRYDKIAKKNVYGKKYIYKWNKKVCKEQKIKTIK